MDDSQMTPNSVDGVVRAFEEMDMQELRVNHARGSKIILVTQELKDSWRLTEFNEMQQTLREEHIRKARIRKQKKEMESKKPKTANNHLETRFNYYTGFVDSLRKLDVKKYAVLDNVEEEQSAKKEERKKKNEKGTEKNRKKKREKKLTKKRIMINTIHEESDIEPDEIIEPQPGPSRLSYPTSKQEKRKKGSELMSCSEDERGKQKQARIEELQREEELDKQLEHTFGPDYVVREGLKRKNNTAYSSCSEDENVCGSPKLFCRPDDSFCSTSSCSSSSCGSCSSPNHGVMSPSESRSPSASPVQSVSSNSTFVLCVVSRSCSTSTSSVPSVDVKIHSSSGSSSSSSSSGSASSNSSSGSSTPTITSDSENEQVLIQWIVPSSTSKLKNEEQMEIDSTSSSGSGSSTPTITSDSENEQVLIQWIVPSSTSKLKNEEQMKIDSTSSSGSGSSTPTITSDSENEQVWKQWIMPPSTSKSKNEKQMKIDNSEPQLDGLSYCYCGQVAYGQMIACDSDNCEHGLYHLPCVRLFEKPHGTWFCPTCLINFKRP